MRQGQSYIIHNPQPEDVLHVRRNHLQTYLKTVIELVEGERGFVSRLNDAIINRNTLLALHNMSASDTERNMSSWIYDIVQHIAFFPNSILTTNASHGTQPHSRTIIIPALRTVMVVPIMRHHETIGIIYVDARVRNRVFRQHDLSIVEFAADQLASML